MQKTTAQTILIRLQRKICHSFSHLVAFLGLLLVLAPLQGNALEGFFSERPQGDAGKCWDATVWLYSASGVIVKKVPAENGAIDVFVLTADHVFSGANPATVYVNFDRDTSRQFGWLNDPMGEVVIGKVMRDPRNDLALIRIRVGGEGDQENLASRLAKLDSITPVEMMNCSSVTSGLPVFQTGFPATILRKGGQVPIEDPETVKKRWSMGSLLPKIPHLQASLEGSSREVPLNKMNSYDFDAISGDSGGPICSLQGELISVLSNGDNSAEYGLHYASVCNAVEAFLEKNLTTIRDMPTPKRKAEVAQ